MSSTDTPTDAEDAAPATDDAREALLATITGLVGDAIVASHTEVGRELVIRVSPQAWKHTHKQLRDHAGLRFFEFLSAIDWLPSPFGKSEDASVDVGSLVTMVEDAGEPEPGYAGGSGRFQVFTRLVDITSENSLGVVIKTDVDDPRDDPDGGGQLESLIPVFPGANWHERETHEMFGIRFSGHPYLENLYLPTEFEGNPLRKDFPLLARHVKPWPGIVDVEPMPDEDDDEGDAD